jgi:hypothetical protein
MGSIEAAAAPAVVKTPDSAALAAVVADMGEADALAAFQRIARQVIASHTARYPTRSVIHWRRASRSDAVSHAAWPRCTF